MGMTPGTREAYSSGFLFAQNYWAQRRNSASVSFEGVVSLFLGLRPFSLSLRLFFSKLHEICLDVRNLSRRMNRKAGEIYEPLRPKVDEGIT
jgi:hypothetical protein